ncbi:hypothetical protein IAT38_003953 [Cryptococcus sp. DSM 104549]
MAFLFRSTLRASSSRIPQPILAPALTAFLPRFNSSSPSSSSNSAPRKNNPFSRLVFDLPEARTPSSAAASAASSASAGGYTSSPNPEDAEAWWMTASRLAAARQGDCTKYYTGRSVATVSGGDYLSAYKRLQIHVRNGNLKREEKLNQHHEKPGLKRQRLASERHRRRFKAMVREKVQQVIAMRNR